MTQAIGIDLGTTNSLLAHCTGGDSTIIRNRSGRRKTPSVVSLTNDGFYVGQQAKNQLVSNPDWSVGSIKRYIGENKTIQLGNQSYTPVELSSVILEYLKKSAEEHIGNSIDEAVITVPAYFDHRQRVATEQAARLAGIDVLRIMNEPTAACLSYGLRESGHSSTVLVYDLGGGTFDISLIEMVDDVYEVLGTDGDDQLGGDDWDGAIVDWLLERINQKYRLDVPNPVPLLVEERLLKAAREAKHTLSNKSSADVRIPFLEIGSETITVEETLTRSEFEGMNAERLQRTIDLSTELCDSVSVTDIDEIILVGGSTRMPMVQNALEDEFGITPQSGVRVDEAVARGAAIQAAILAQKSLPDVADSENASPVLPDGVDDDLLLIDSTSKALGIGTYDRETDKNYFSNIIPRHSSIPAQNERTGYTTIEDFQRHVDITVYQSKTATLGDAEELETFEVGPIPERPAGEVTFAVEFILTEDGTLRVEITDAEGFAKEEVEISSAVEVSEGELREQKRNLPSLITE